MSLLQMSLKGRITVTMYGAIFSTLRKLSVPTTTSAKSARDACHLLWEVAHWYCFTASGLSPILPVARCFASRGVTLKLYSRLKSQVRF